MRKVMLRVAGLMLLIGLLAVPLATPDGALAAPQITVTPKQGPNSTLFIVTGAGFTANSTVYLQIVSQDGSARITFDDASTSSDADGYLLAGFSFGSSVPAGTYVASIATAATGGTILASTNLALTGPNGAKPGPDIVITPSQARGGDTFILTGTGFPVSSTFTLRVQSENRQTTINFNNSDLASDDLGIILSGITLSAQRPAGAYIAEVLTKGANPTVLASATFSLVAGGASPSPSPSTSPRPSTSPSPSASPSPRPSASPVPSPPATGSGGFLPGLPNTGGGGMSSGGGMSGGDGGLYVGIALFVSTVIGVGLALRRRAA